MKYINLTKNKKAIVDDDDFVYLNKWRWHVMANKYAARRKGHNGKYLYMHVVLMGKNGVDHINGNGFDNRRSNLRICSQQDNVRNAKIRLDNTSGYKGVGWHKSMNRWRARIKIDGREIRLGYFVDRMEAAKAYNRAAIKHFGEFARLNQL